MGITETVCKNCSMRSASASDRWGKANSSASVMTETYTGTILHVGDDGVGIKGIHTSWDVITCRLVPTRSVSLPAPVWGLVCGPSTSPEYAATARPVRVLSAVAVRVL